MATAADAASDPRSGDRESTGQARLDWNTALIWLLGFGAVVYLGLKGGGYDPLVHDQVGIAAWWILLGTVLVGALPRRRLGPLGWAALGLLGAFLAWTAFSLSWTESSERTFAEIARVGGYLGFFALALLARQRGGARRMVAAVACGVGVVTLVALLSRLHPSWFGSEIHQTSAFLPGSAERLSYPVNYWNGLAGLIAIGLPLTLQMASDARMATVRALAAALLPAMLLTLYFTLSRGGIGAAAIAVVVFFAFTSDRLPKLLTGAIAGAGGALLIAVASSHFSLVHGAENETARQQGNDVLLLALAVCAIVGVLVGVLALASRGIERPRWTLPSKTFSLAALAISVVVLLVAALAIGAPGRAGDAWSEFKESDTPVGGANRLGSVAGESRYAIWASAVREMKSSPVHGTGAGTFEYWWNRDATDDETVVDAHSLYLQVLGELGVVGFLLIVSFFAVVLLGGAVVSLRAVDRRRSALAAALAACTAFCVSGSVDWVWQIPALAVAMLLLAGTLVSSGDPDAPEGESALRPLPRAGVVVAAIVLIAAIAMPLATTSLLRQSQSEARAGHARAALEDAGSAQNAEPFAASPRLQEALLLEGSGMLGAAAAEARAATERESTNWRTWLVLSRIEARRGRAEAAIAAYRRARSLNPRSPLFER
jgi:O-antigen ligase